MRFGKTRMFFYLNTIAFFILFCFSLPWLFSATTIGKIITPYEANTIHVAYRVKEKNYTGSYMRNDVSFTERVVTIRYVSFRPQKSCVNSFMGMWAEPLAWWSVFLLASGMLLLTQNTVFSKGTIFQLQKSYPWISMEEYFPFAGEWYYQNKTREKSKNRNGEIPRLQDCEKK